MKSVQLLIVFLAIFIVTGCSSIQRMDSTRMTVVNIPSVDGVVDWGPVGRSLQQGVPVVVKISKGQKVPLEMNAALPMLEVKEGKSEVVFKQDIYLYLSREKVKISPDGQRWANIHDLKSLKKLFGFDKGAVSLGIGVSKEKGGFILINVTTE